MGFLLAGAVIAGCSTVPLAYNKKNKERLEILVEFSELIKEVAHEVRYLLTPIPEALKNAKGHRSEKVRKTVDDFLYGLSKCGIMNSNIDKVWKSAILYNKENLGLSDKECGVLYQFGEYIASNNYSISAVESSMTVVIERVDKLILDTKNQQDKYGPMYNKLGLLLGVAISIFAV